jgi:hypothetical protein
MWRGRRVGGRQPAFVPEQSGSRHCRKAGQERKESIPTGGGRVSLNMGGDSLLRVISEYFCGAVLLAANNFVHPLIFLLKREIYINNG